MKNEKTKGGTKALIRRIVERQTKEIASIERQLQSLNDPTKAAIDNAVIIEFNRRITELETLAEKIREALK